MSTRRRRSRSGNAPIAVQGQRIINYAKRPGVVKWIEEHCKERSAARRAIRLAIKDQMEEQKEAERLARALRISRDPLAMVQTANSQLLSAELWLGLVTSWVELYPRLFTGRGDDLVRISESIISIANQLVGRLEGGQQDGGPDPSPHVPKALPPAPDGPSATNGDVQPGPEAAHEWPPGPGHRDAGHRDDEEDDSVADAI